MSCNCSTTKTNCGCKSCETLSKVLADSYVLLLKTQNVHWNVVSSDFISIHLMTDQHYNNLFCAIDVIAERIRMLGGVAPATFKEFAELASINDELTAKSGKEMLEALLAAHEAIRNDIKTGLVEISDAHDYGTETVLTDRLAFHEKTIWMLKSILN